MKPSEVNKLQVEIRGKLYTAGIENGKRVPKTAEEMHNIVCEIVIPIIKREVKKARTE